MIEFFFSLRGLIVFLVGLSFCKVLSSDFIVEEKI